MADPAELAVQAAVGLVAAAIGAGATVWAATQSLRGAALVDREQRHEQEVEQRRSALEAAVGELELGAILLTDGRFETQSTYVAMPRAALDRVLEYLTTLPQGTASAVQQAALRTAIYNSYAAASLQPGGKVAPAVARDVANDTASAMNTAVTALRAHLKGDKEQAASEPEVPT
jgi:hypothetical protein